LVDKLNGACTRDAVVSAAVLVCLVLWGAAQVADAQSCTPFQGSPLTNYKCDVISEGTNILLRANQTYPAVRHLSSPSIVFFMSDTTEQELFRRGAPFLHSVP
jgi:hypothetical protein